MHINMEHQERRQPWPDCGPEHRVEANIIDMSTGYSGLEIT